MVGGAGQQTGGRAREWCQRTRKDATRRGRQRVAVIRGGANFKDRGRRSAGTVGIDRAAERGGKIAHVGGCSSRHHRQQRCGKGSVLARGSSLGIGHCATDMVGSAGCQTGEFNRRCSSGDVRGDVSRRQRTPISRGGAVFEDGARDGAAGEHRPAVHRRGCSRQTARADAAHCRWRGGGTSGEGPVVSVVDKLAVVDINALQPVVVSGRWQETFWSR